VTFIGASIAVFILMRLVPGDPALMVLPEGATLEEMNRVRELMGLDKPMWAQYLDFVGDALRGDFGDSFQHAAPALDVVVERLPKSIYLGATALLITVVIGVPIGILAAVRRGSWFDFLASLTAILSQSTPSFWLGLMLIFAFSLGLRWFPVAGSQTWKHVVLPAVTLAVYPISLVLRLTRTSFLEVLGADYIRTAEAKGLRGTAVLLKHALKNAAIPVVTVLCLQIAGILAGAVVVENVFSWPGIGMTVIAAVNLRDYPILQVALLLSSAAFITVNLVADLLYAVLDPRIRYG